MVPIILEVQFAKVWRESG